MLLLFCHEHADGDIDMDVDGDHQEDDGIDEVVMSDQRPVSLSTALAVHSNGKDTVSPSGESNGWMIASSIVILNK